MKTGEECTRSLIEALGWTMRPYILEDDEQSEARVFYRGTSRIIWIPKDKGKKKIEGNDLGTIFKTIELKPLRTI